MSGSPQDLALTGASRDLDLVAAKAGGCDNPCHTGWEVARAVFGYKMRRNYRKEYDNYHSKPKQKKNRAKRNAARDIMEKAGKVSKGDGKMWVTRSH